MIVVKGKNLIFNVSIVLFLLGIGILFAQSKNNSNSNTILTASLPVSNKVIVLDAGHRSEKMEELL